jgi:Tfp pilus assembly protein PilX
MKLDHCSRPEQQRGAILVITLVFLIAISMLTVSSMQSSNIGLHMAQNEESRLTAAQGAQALADAIVSIPAATPVIGGAGFTICTAGEADCNRTDLPITDPVLATAIANGHISARVKREGQLFRPPPRSVESSIDKFSSASFEVTTTYDRSDEGLGMQQITEGILVLVPKF